LLLPPFHPSSFGIALAVIVIWAVTGPIFRFQKYLAAVHQHRHNRRHLLMVFLIQNTQNRDGAAMQIKLDELIRALQGAHNELADLEDMTERELQGQG
jgi:low affinity Fe/Cu permease